MSKKLTILTIAAILLALTLGRALAIEEESQNFTTDPGWTSLNSPTWGYQSSSINAGGPAGEAGGNWTFQTGKTYYADTDLAGTLTEADKFFASGTAYFAYDKPAFGFFDKDDANPETSFTGFREADLHVSGGWVKLYLDGTHVGNSGSATWLSKQVVYWQFTYDGADGISAKVADNSGFTGNVLSWSGSKAGADFDIDSFGMPQLGLTAENRGPMYFDNLGYSIVPEPATVAILGLGSLVLLRRRR